MAIQIIVELQKLRGETPWALSLDVDNPDESEYSSEYEEFATEEEAMSYLRERMTGKVVEKMWLCVNRTGVRQVFERDPATDRPADTFEVAPDDHLGLQDVKLY